MTPPDPIKSVEARELLAHKLTRLLRDARQVRLSIAGDPAWPLERDEKLRDEAALSLALHENINEIIAALAQRDQYCSLLQEAVAQLEPIALTADAIDSRDPTAPGHMCALRASFDYWTRHAGPNNDEIVERDGIRVSDLRGIRTFLAKITAALAPTGGE